VFEERFVEHENKGSTNSSNSIFPPHPSSNSLIMRHGKCYTEKQCGNFLKWPFTDFEKDGLPEIIPGL
jgi:hypothetical protein